MARNGGSRKGHALMSGLCRVGKNAGIAWPDQWQSYSIFRGPDGRRHTAKLNILIPRSIGIGFLPLSSTTFSLGCFYNFTGTQPLLKARHWIFSVWCDQPPKGKPHWDGFYKGTGSLRSGKATFFNIKAKLKALSFRGHLRKKPETTTPMIAMMVELRKGLDRFQLQLLELSIAPK